MKKTQDSPETFGNTLWKLLGSCAIIFFAHYPQADGQIECMNRTIGQILCAYLLDEDLKHWLDYVAVSKMAINSTINASIKQSTI